MLRYFLERDAELQGAALRLFLCSVASCLRAHSPGSGPAARLGAVAFIHRFGYTLNPHLHFHCVVIDGAFDAATKGGVIFHAATGLDATAIASVVCLSVAALALMPSVARADLIQIDDLGESIVVTFTSTGSGSLGTITNTGESVIIPHTYWQHVGLCRERRRGVVTVTLKGQASRRTHAS